MLLVNSDIYSIISGHRNYFMDLKNTFDIEINRYIDLYDDVNCKNHELEKELKSLKKEYEKEKERLEKEIYYYKDKVKNKLKIFNFIFTLFSYRKKKKKKAVKQI